MAAPHQRRLTSLSQQVSHRRAAGTRALRVGVVAFVHETNTFAAEWNDTMDSVSITRGPAMLSRAHPKTFIGGFREVTRNLQGWPRIHKFAQKFECKSLFIDY
jgi:hypothetical protein